jgi:hypothetical protein
MRTCGLVTAGKCGSSQNAVRHVDEKKERENDKAKDRVRLQSLSLTAGVVVLVRGRLRMINHAVNPDFAEKKEQAWETRVARKTRKRTSNSS